MNITREQLKGTNYLWTEEAIAGKLLHEGPSRRVFNRFNGYQLLAMIQYFAGQYDVTADTDQLKLENMLLHYLPFGLKSELSVFNWLTSTYAAVSKLQN